ncbi:MAG: ATP-binding protein [Saprospirales bacterium]|nr:ATP-binding protein [Saprospirales bacterium]
MYPRKLLDRLEYWKKKPNRKPLILRGARQVGKTTLVKLFGQRFKHFIHMNLEKDEDKDLFDQITRVDQLLQTLRLQHNIPANSFPFLLFIDEIQESPKAIKNLRFFYEDFPEVHVIAAGSLLEFALKDVSSFPVGRVEYLNLYPLDFEEFLQASARENYLAVLNEIPAPGYAHPLLLDAFHTYALLGGMPEIVQVYLQTNDLVALEDVYNGIWRAYKDDIPKYGRTRTEQVVLRHIIETAHTEIENRIAMEGFGASQYRHREVSEALRALDLAGIIRLIFPTTDLVPPLAADFKKRPRLQFLDTGLLAQIMGIQPQMIGIQDLNDLFRGKIIQHLVTQQLIAQHPFPEFKPHFWVREKKTSSAEVDLVYPYGKYVIPIEVKSGTQGKLRSLHQFIDRCSHKYGVRVYAGELSVESAHTPAGKPYLLLNLPYYLSTKIPEYVKWFVEEHP